jgi:hypothetical protein
MPSSASISISASPEIAGDRAPYGCARINGPGWWSGHFYRDRSQLLEVKYPGQGLA